MCQHLLHHFERMEEPEGNLPVFLRIFADNQRSKRIKQKTRYNFSPHKISRKETLEMVK